MQTHMAEYFIRFIKFQNEYTNVTKFSNEKNNPFNQDLAVRNANLQKKTLSTHIWKLKKRKIEYDIKWRIVKQAPVYSKESGGCQLCLEEKTFIMYADMTRKSL